MQSVTPAEVDVRLFKLTPEAGAAAAAVAQPPPVSVPPALPAATLPCRARGCGRQTGVQCAYTDRRGRRCDTAWCEEHVLAIGGRPYCRRHGGVVRAVADEESAGMPDLGNRAPSLLEWVAQRVDQELTAAVGELAAPGQQVQTDHARLVLLHQNAGERLHAWQRTWKLCDHTGVQVWVALDVEERNDTELVVRVNATTVARAVPPWITASRAGATHSSSEGADADAFYAHVVAVVRQNLGLA